VRDDRQKIDDSLPSGDRENGAYFPSRSDAMMRRAEAALRNTSGAV